MYIVYKRIVYGNSFEKNDYEYQWYNRLENLLHDHPTAERDDGTFKCYKDGCFYKEIQTED